MGGMVGRKLGTIVTTFVLNTLIKKKMQNKEQLFKEQKEIKKIFKYSNFQLFVAIPINYLVLNLHET